MTAAVRSASKVIWRPHPGPQTRLLACPVFEALFGGARGGGKTGGMIGDFAAHVGRFPAHAGGLMLRRERTQLRDTIENAARIYEPLGREVARQGLAVRVADRRQHPLWLCRQRSRCRGLPGMEPDARLRRGAGQLPTLGAHRQAVRRAPQRPRRAVPVPRHSQPRRAGAHARQGALHRPGAPATRS
jgi:hypothetical protein